MTFRRALTTGLAAGFETASLGGDFTSAGLPPLMACSDGLASPGFALAALSAVLTDLLALFIVRAPCCPRPGPRYKVLNARDTTPRPCFCLLCQHLKPASNGVLQRRHGRVTKWCGALDGSPQKVKTPIYARPILATRARFHGR